MRRRVVVFRFKPPVTANDVPVGGVTVGKGHGLDSTWDAAGICILLA